MISISDDHKLCMRQLSKLIPDLDPEDPDVWQRIFNLGLFALTMQAVSKSLDRNDDKMVQDLVETARKTLDKSWFKIGTM